MFEAKQNHSSSLKLQKFSVMNSKSIFTEDFSSGTFPPSGWSIVGEGQDNWDAVDFNYAGGTPPEAVLEYWPEFNGISRLVTSAIATSGYDVLMLEFKHNLMDYSGGYTIKVETTTDGITWNEVWSHDAAGNTGAEIKQITIANDDVGSDNFQMAFTFDGASMNLDYWFIDDIILGEPASVDVAVASIDIPSYMEEDTTIVPTTTVQNLGVEEATFNVTFEILNESAVIYSEIIQVVDLTASESETIEFSTWNAIPGNIEARVSTDLENDEVPENDTLIFNAVVEAIVLEPANNLEGTQNVQIGEDVVLNWESPHELFFEGFEGEYLPAGWSKFNLDGGTGWEQIEVGLEYPPGWSIGGPITACPYGSNFQAYASWSTGGDPLSDQWLVTPLVTVNEGDRLNFWLGVYLENWSEYVEVLLSTTDPDDPAAFTTVIDSIDILPVIPAPGWVKYSYDLSDFVAEGTPVYIAFRETVADNYNEGNATSLDNIYIGPGYAVTGEFLGYNIYQKYNDDDYMILAFTSDTTYTHTIDSEGISSYYVTAVYTLGESLPTDEFVVDILTGINENLENSLRLYPQPASEVVSIESDYSLESITIFNISGQQVWAQFTRDNKMEINISTFQPGVYFVNVFSHDQFITKKLVIE
jgi:hypothetical protein